LIWTIRAAGKHTSDRYFCMNQSYHDAVCSAACVVP
jgi:hypothetical protein